MNEFAQYNLKQNPFRTVPAANPDDIIWAGFSHVREKMEQRIKRSIKTKNSSLVLNFGEYGSGKTHAAKYFQKQSVLASIANDSTLPYSLYLNFPQGKEPVRELYIQVIDKLDIDGLRAQVNQCDVPSMLQESTDNMLIRNVLKLLFDETVSSTQIKAYLYGNTTIKSSLIKENVQRKLDSDNDFTEFLAALFSFLTYQKSVYSCVIIWIDEFENMAMLNVANVSKMNRCIRTLMDKAPNNLLIFMNLTQSTMIDVSDLSVYLEEAVRRRIKENIELPIPEKDEVKEYIIDLLNDPIYRVGETAGFSPFTEDVVDLIIEKLGKSVSLREYNLTFSTFLEYAASDNQEIINLEYYNKVVKDIIG